MRYEVLGSVGIPRIPTKHVESVVPLAEERFRLASLVMTIHSGLAGLLLIELSTKDKTSVEHFVVRHYFFFDDNSSFLTKRQIFIRIIISKTLGAKAMTYSYLGNGSITFIFLLPISSLIFIFIAICADQQQTLEMYFLCFKLAHYYSSGLLP